MMLEENFAQMPGLSGVVLENIGKHDQGDVLVSLYAVTYLFAITYICISQSKNSGPLLTNRHR